MSRKRSLPNRAAPQPRRLVLLLVLLFLAAAAATSRVVLPGRAQPVAEAPTERLDCLSYAPFRGPGETPFDPMARVDPQRVEADLEALARRTGCVRTYSIDQGLDAVPGIAARLGMKVLLGAWLGRDRLANTVELERAIELARTYPGTVRALVVGNEVLLRRELPEYELAAALHHARRQAGVPVTYADVWEFWLRHPTLVESVDFVTIHILPYWEDEPVGIENAVAHVRDIYRMAQRELAGAGQPAIGMLIGETGWPSEGRPRREAQPGRVEQARFVREFVAMAQAEGIPYNLIEAFDQPWKRQLEGAMGGHWGIFERDGAAKFPWHGPVVADPHWQRGVWSAVLGALGFALAALVVPRLHARGAPRALFPTATPVLAHALAGLAVGAVLFAQWRYLQTWNRWAVEWAATLPFLVATAPLAWLGLQGALSNLASGITSGTGQGAAARPATAPARMLDRLRDLFLFGAAVNLVLLVFDARYRGFPMAFFVVPAAVEALRLLSGRSASVSNETRLLALVVAVSAVCVAVLERPENGPALAYCVLVLGYALARVDGRLLRTRTRPPSSAPIADGS